MCDWQQLVKLAIWQQCVLSFHLQLLQVGAALSTIGGREQSRRRLLDSIEFVHGLSEVRLCDLRMQMCVEIWRASGSKCDWTRAFSHVYKGK